MLPFSLCCVGLHDSSRVGVHGTSSCSTVYKYQMVKGILVYTVQGVTRISHILGRGLSRVHRGNACFYSRIGRSAPYHPRFVILPHLQIFHRHMHTVPCQKST